MNILLLFVLILLINKFFCQKNGFRESLLYTFIAITSVIYLSTEALNAFHAITAFNISLVYIGLILIIIIFNRSNFKDIKFNHLRKLLKFIRRIPLIYRIITVLIAIHLLAIFIAGLYYPPNSYDGATCWVARVEHWIRNRSLDFFPTHFSLQNTHQPLSSFIFLHLHLLSHSDHFDNIVQFFYLLGTSTALTLIIKDYSLKLKHQVLGFIISITIPLAVLQASASLNDLITSFYVICTFYFLRRILIKFELKNLAFFSLSISFAILTKVTVIPFITVFVLYFLIKNLMVKDFKRAIQVSSITIVVVSLFCLPYLTRNYVYTGSMLGTDSSNEATKETLQEMRGEHKNLVISALSVCSKYIGYEFLTQSKKINKLNEKIVIKFHDLLGIKFQATSNSVYIPDTSNNYEETSKNNFIFIILLLISTILSFFTAKHPIKIMLALGVIALFSFCLLLPAWDMFRGRYLLPLHFLMIPFITNVIFSFSKKKYLVVVLIFTLIINGLYISAKSNMRPIPPVSDIRNNIRILLKKPPGTISDTVAFKNSYVNCKEEEKELLNYYTLRNDEYILNKGISKDQAKQCFELLGNKNLIDDILFNDRLKYLSIYWSPNDFYRMVDYIKIRNYKKIGLYVSRRFMEYSLWNMLDAQKNNINIQAVFNETEASQYDVVIVFDKKNYNEIFSNHKNASSFGPYITLLY